MVGDLVLPFPGSLSASGWCAHGVCGVGFQHRYFELHWQEGQRMKHEGTVVHGHQSGQVTGWVAVVLIAAASCEKHWNWVDKWSQQKLCLSALAP